ncbi:MAG: citrulline utilization hydrolase CtlX [Steroidobacteraceae bacterium]
MQQPQCADAVLMVRPAAFDYNPETAASNRMQKRSAPGASESSAPSVGDRARAELEQVAHALRAEGIRVCVAEDTADPPKPDAVFPNNWVSFHADGTVVLYPMHAPSRRRERRREIIDQAAEELGYRIRRTLDLTHHEAAGRYLEGTGSLVLDHAGRIAYACRSSRTDEDVLEEWCRAMQYEPMPFAACDRTGAPLYHTNIMLGIGARLAIVAADAIAPEDRRRVMSRLEASGRELIEIGQDGIERFAGNVLELASCRESRSRSEPPGDRRVLVLSRTAREALDAPAFARLAACTDAVLTVEIPTIEQLGGGGVRCMLAEVFSPS